MKSYYKIKIYDAVYAFQHNTWNSEKQSSLDRAPCCVAENGVVLGTNNICYKYNINSFEPLKEALLKYADLYVEPLQLDSLLKQSEQFFDICSRFGKTRAMAFDECLLEISDINGADINMLLSAIRDELLSEMNVECDIQLFDDFSQSINPYSASVAWSENALEILAEILTFKLAMEGSEAKMFSLEITDESGICRTVDRRVDVACSDYDMILFMLKNILDVTTKASLVTANLYDICLKQTESAEEADSKKVRRKAREISPINHAKHNSKLCDLINSNKLYVYDRLCEYVQNNVDNLAFHDLVALCEKANTRRLKLGNYYINHTYVQKFVDEFCADNQQRIDILINGYCPLMLLFELNDAANVDLYITNIDNRTLKLIKLLEKYSPYKTLEFKRTEKSEYDVQLASGVDFSYKAKTDVLLVKKTFFSSDDKEAIKNSRISQIFDFGNYGVIGSVEQFAALVVSRSEIPDTTKIYSLDDGSTVVQQQAYITDDSLPCWVLYRNKAFDIVYSKLQFDLFDVKLSTQIKQRDYKTKGDICVISASCIDNNGNVHISNNCRHVSAADIRNYDIANFAQRDDVLFSAATSTVLKIARKPKGCLPNQSTVLLIPKRNVEITRDDLNYYLTDEFRGFYNVALNRQSFALSSDRLSQYFLGKAVS